MADKEAQRFKRIYDRRVGAVALCPGDKVLTKLDVYIGTRRKLKNRWHSQIHMVVHHVADGVPTYVVWNDSNGNKGVFNRERLLLWIAADTDGNDGMRSNPAIAVQVADGLVEGDMSDGKAVPLEGDYGLSLAMFRTILGPPPPPQDRLDGRCTTMEVVQKKVGQETSDVGGDKPLKTGDTIVVEDVPP